MKSVKRRTESGFRSFPFSRPLHGLRSLWLFVPAVNCWAIVSRPLTRTGRIAIDSDFKRNYTLAMIAGWITTRKLKGKMEKNLGRKLQGKHELTSLKSWMEASQNDETQKPR